MKTLKKYGKTILIFLGILCFFSIILSLFNLFSILYTKGTNLFIFIVMILTLFFIGFTWGKKALKKGYLEGLKIGLCLIFLLIVINLLFYRTGFSIERIIYYCVLILSSVLGSMIGINKKH